MAQNHVFWDKIAERYAKRPVGDAASYQIKLDKTRDYLTPHAQVLEFGCGTGTTALYHAPHVAQILALDISHAMLEIARGKARAAGIDNVSFQQKTLDDPSLDGLRFDVVMGHSILHLLADYPAAIARVFELLTPGGVFISSTACLKDLSLLLRPAIAVAQALGKAPEVAYFSKAELIAALQKAGFAIDHIWQPGPRKAAFIVARKPV